MKFNLYNGSICPICGKPRISTFKGHIAGTPVHPECSKKMQEMHQEKSRKTWTPRMTDKSIEYLRKTGEQP